jgi:hypothetical protein
MTTADHVEITPIEVPDAPHSAPESIALSPESLRVGLKLDEHHPPETNGWMAVCRRCGMRTDGPEGLHAPPLSQVARAEEWLEGAILGSSIAKLKLRQDT